MDIQSSVGRRQGRNSQNRVTDQEIVQSLLNRIPVSQGGAGGSLGDPLVNGMCGDRLFEAIMRFQRHHIGNRADGHVDPHGPTITALNRLSEQASGNRPSIQALTALPIAPLRAPQTGPHFSDGGTPLNDPVSRRRAAWVHFNNDVRGALRNNPNLTLVMTYLSRLERAAGPNAPTVPAFTVFGNASVSGQRGFQNARALRRGEQLYTWDDPNVVLLAPPATGDACGSLFQFARQTAFVSLGTHHAQVTGSARNTVVGSGLRGHLGQLSGRR